MVYKRNQKHYALKVLNKAQLVKKKVIRSAIVEKDALIALGTRPDSHPGVIRLHHCFQDTSHLCELTNASIYLQATHSCSRFYPGSGIQW